MARKKRSKEGGFVACDCKDVKNKPLPVTGNNCICKLISKFQEKKSTFGIKKLSGISSVVVRKS